MDDFSASIHKINLRLSIVRKFAIAALLGCGFHTVQRGYHFGQDYATRLLYDADKTIVWAALEDHVKYSNRLIVSRVPIINTALTKFYGAYGSYGAMIGAKLGALTASGRPLDTAIKDLREQIVASAARARAAELSKQAPTP